MGRAEWEFDAYTSFADCTCGSEADTLPERESHKALY